MQPVSPWIRRNLRVRHHGLLSSLSGSVPAGGAGSRIVRRHGNQGLAHSSAAVLPLRVFLQLLAVLVVTLGLLESLGMCRRVSRLQAHGSNSYTARECHCSSRPDRNVQCLRHRNRHH